MLEGRLEEGEKLCRRGLAVAQQAASDSPHVPACQNTLAWLLATCPLAPLRNPDAAVAAAENAVALGPQVASYWHTLGVARYRAGDYQAALDAFDKTWELQGWFTSYDWFFLAMARWQLGDEDEARESFEKAVTWMERYSREDPQLRRFRAEATELLGIDEEANGQEPSTTPPRSGDSP